MFYGSDMHAVAAAAILSVIASCRVHRLDPFAYLESPARLAVLAAPPVPGARAEEWVATRARLRPEELAAPLSAFEISAEASSPAGAGSASP